VTPERLRDLPNLGPASEAMLLAAGIATPDDLDRLGPVEAYLRAVHAGAPRHTMLLWSLDAALLGVDWRDVPLERRREVSAQADRAFGAPPGVPDATDRRRRLTSAAPGAGPRR
jgi:DNA transformation protein